LLENNVGKMNGGSIRVEVFDVFVCTSGVGRIRELLHQGEIKTTLFAEKHGGYVKRY
jgi:hypothetical protein